MKGQYSSARPGGGSGGGAIEAAETALCRPGCEQFRASRSGPEERPGTHRLCGEREEAAKADCRHTDGGGVGLCPADSGWGGLGKGSLFTTGSEASLHEQGLIIKLSRFL